MQIPQGAMIRPVSTVYLTVQLRHEFYNSVTFSVKLLSVIATFHQCCCHVLVLFTFIFFDTFAIQQICDCSEMCDPVKIKKCYFCDRVLKAA